MDTTTKLPNLESDYFSYITPLIKDYKAINMAEGYTGFHCDPKLIQLVEGHISQGLNQLAPMAGELALREATSQKLEAQYGKKYSAETEITITAGATQAIYACVSAFVQEGDEVIIFEPASTNYAAAIEMCGGQPVFVPLEKPDYHIDWEKVQMAISSQTRMIIINTPHAPSGWSMSEIDMIRLQRLINGTKIVILSDETFEHIIFDGEVHQSVAQYPKLAERSICVSSFGETYHVSGWQIGYCAAPEELMRKIRKVQRVMVYSVNSPFQLALADYIADKSAYEKLGAFYQAKRNLFLSHLDETKFKAIPSKGSFFQVIDFEGVSEVKDSEIALSLLTDYGIAATPMSIFYHEKVKSKALRFNIAKPDELLIEAANKLNGF